MDDELRRDISSHYGQWIAEHEWTHIAHFTFRARVSVEGAKRTVAAFVRRIEQRGRMRVNYMFSIERHRSGAPHVHGVLYTASLDTGELSDAWTYGRAQIEPFRRELGGAYYAMKEAHLEESEVVFSRRFLKR